MKIWIDMTAPAHPVVFRPIIRRLREAGHEVEVTARDYAQTLALLELHGMDHTAFGHHGGASRLGKFGQLLSRARAMRKFGRKKGFDLALAHGSNDLAIAARRLKIPAVNMFDYEWATVQHNIGCRPARRVITPDSIPPERLRRYGVGPDKLAQYPGLKEEYYLADFEPDRTLPQRLGLDMEKVVVVVRPPPDVSLYHRKSNPLFPQVLTHLGRHEGVQAVVLPRTEAQREYVKALELPSVVVPEGAVDAQTLVALADLVVSAGGTMNREAVALGTPVYTTYGGRLGGVDEALIRENRLRPLTDPRGLELQKRNTAGEQHRRDPALLVDMILGAVHERSPHPSPRPNRGARSAVAAGACGGGRHRARPRASRSPSATSEMAHEGHEHRGVDTALRGLDLGIAGVSLVVLSPVLGRDRGLDQGHLGRPVLYRGRRVGRAGRIFTMLKFRTLTAGRRGAARPVPRRGAHPAHADGGHAPRPRAALRPPRRAAAALERPARRHEHRRPASDPAARSSRSCARRSRSTGSGWWSSRA